MHPWMIASNSDSLTSVAHSFVLIVESPTFTRTCLLLASLRATFGRSVKAGDKLVPNPGELNPQGDVIVPPVQGPGYGGAGGTGGIHAPMPPPATTAPGTDHNESHCRKAVCIDVLMKLVTSRNHIVYSPVTVLPPTSISNLGGTNTASMSSREDASADPGANVKTAPTTGPPGGHAPPVTMPPLITTERRDMINDLAMASP